MLCAVFLQFSNCLQVQHILRIVEDYRYAISIPAVSCLDPGIDSLSPAQCNACAFSSGYFHDGSSCRKGKFCSRKVSVNFCEEKCCS